MILVDTSVWIDHLHTTDADLVDRLEAGEVCTHDMVIGELALGSLRDRETVVALLDNLPTLPGITHAEVMFLVEHERLHGRGLSLIDAHLLGAVRIAVGTSLWTRDKRLAAVANELGVGVFA